MVDGDLLITYVFNLSGKVFFKPKIRVQASRFFILDGIGQNDLNSFIFNMGMVELISYWKASCPKEVNILPSRLNEEQVAFWKKLYYHGLGEFYYLNGIDIDQESAIYLTSTGQILPELDKELNENRVLVPIGGGKDSIVTLELLKKSSFEVIPLIVNPREASWRTIENAGFTKDDCIVIHRSIDNELLELNKKGYLNGHTPFSAMLAFTSSLIGYLTRSKYVALSNESSANESTVPDSKINHQYSKSFEFELDFHNYSTKYLLKELHYFSFLRPLNELQIARLFSKYKYHHHSFRSCNVGSKTDSWCGSCPKCLFTYIMLKPFVKEDELIKIFGKNLLDDEDLSQTLKELKGETKVKPFECVGTPEEVGVALNVEESRLNDIKLLREFNQENLVPDRFNTILKKALDVS